MRPLHKNITHPNGEEVAFLFVGHVELSKTGLFQQPIIGRLQRRGYSPVVQYLRDLVSIAQQNKLMCII